MTTPLGTRTCNANLAGGYYQKLAALKFLDEGCRGGAWSQTFRELSYAGTGAVRGAAIRVKRAKRFPIEVYGMGLFGR
jgi:hypothetical protein